MGLVLAPIAADKLNAWQGFMEEIAGPRKAEFDAFNRRYNLTRHDAWLCQTPMGAVVCAIHEGPGADEMMPKVAQSTNEFDKWFVSKLAEIHGMDLSQPPPGPMPVRKLHWSST